MFQPQMRQSLRCGTIATGFLLLAAQCSVFAADINTPKPSPVVPASPLNLILGIVFLLALVAGAWWLSRRAGTMQWPSQRAAMKVLASLSVGPRERVVLVEIAGEQWALGVAPGRVSLLHRFDEPVITGGNQGDEFGNRLRQVLQNSFGSQK